MLIISEEKSLVFPGRPVLLANREISCDSDFLPLARSLSADLIGLKKSAPISTGFKHFLHFSHLYIDCLGCNVFWRHPREQLLLNICPLRFCLLPGQPRRAPKGGEHQGGHRHGGNYDEGLQCVDRGAVAQA